MRSPRNIIEEMWRRWMDDFSLHHSQNYQAPSQAFERAEKEYIIEKLAQCIMGHGDIPLKSHELVEALLPYPGQKKVYKAIDRIKIIEKKCIEIFRTASGEGAHFSLAPFLQKAIEVKSFSDNADRRQAAVLVNFYVSNFIGDHHDVYQFFEFLFLKCAQDIEVLKLFLVDCFDCNFDTIRNNQGQNILHFFRSALSLVQNPDKNYILEYMVIHKERRFALFVKSLDLNKVDVFLKLISKLATSVEEKLNAYAVVRQTLGVAFVHQLKEISELTCRYMTIAVDGKEVDKVVDVAVKTEAMCC